jgi:hypothetical protein
MLIVAFGMSGVSHSPGVVEKLDEVSAVAVIVIAAFVKEAAPAVPVPVVVSVKVIGLATASDHHNNAGSRKR